MTKSGITHVGPKVLGSALAAVLLLASCGSDGTDDSAETTAAAETQTETETTVDADAETGEDSPVEDTPVDDTEEVEAAEGQVIVKDIVFDVPDGWTSISKGKDIEAALEETNPTILAALKANGQLELLKTVTTTVDWVGVPQQGGSVNIVYAPGDEAETPVSEVAAGVRTGVESRGFTITGEEAFQSPIGDGVRITFDLITPSGESGAGESVVMRVEERLVLMTSDAMTAEQAENQLNQILEAAEIRP